MGPISVIRNEPTGLHFHDQKHHLLCTVNIHLTLCVALGLLLHVPHAWNIIDSKRENITRSAQGEPYMADQEHLDILKQGVEVWNQWRQEHSEVRPDLSGRRHYGVLYEAEFRGIDLHGANL